MAQKSVYEHHWVHGTLPVFRALEVLICAACQHSIAPEDLFVRTASLSARSDGVRHVLCSSCEPMSERVLGASVSWPQPA